MTQKSTSVDTQLSLLASFLSSRHEAILTNWLTRCAQDQSIRVTARLSREEFNDQVPTMLSVLEERLLNQPSNVPTYQIAREHGQHRWHKGYTLHELLNELSHLHQTLLSELNSFWAHQPDTDHEATFIAHQRVSSLIHEAIGGSVAQYNELRQAEDTERALNLQRALDDANELGRKRGVMLRIASHDLRSSFSVIQGAASLLDMPDNTAQERSEMLQILNRNFPRLASMMTELMDLARLEAGREHINSKPFDVAEQMRSLIESAQPLALERNLSIKGEGPAHLLVTGDATKVYRIAQNLLTNALKNTIEGEVSLSWSIENQSQWTLGVQDTGSGLSPAATMWLSDQQRSARKATVLLSEDTGEKAQTMPKPLTDEVVTEGIRAEGEGIGLYIVKRLCELLNASMDVETHTKTGTLIRVHFPLYPSDYTFAD